MKIEEPLEMMEEATEERRRKKGVGTFVADGHASVGEADASVLQFIDIGLSMYLGFQFPRVLCVR